VHGLRASPSPHTRLLGAQESDLVADRGQHGCHRWLGHAHDPGREVSYRSS